MELHDYQKDAGAEIEIRLDSLRSVLLQAATGGGKTVIAAELIKRAVARREPGVFIAHRLELIEQASEKLLAFGIDHGIIKAGFPMRLGERVQVASIQTLFARAIRGKRIELPRADWVFIGECQHCRRYKPGWAAFQFHARFGEWPRQRNVAPVTPSAATRAWVCSRNIAYARSLAQ